MDGNIGMIPIAGVAFAAAIPVIYVVKRFFRKNEEEDGESQGRPRSMSFNSSVMLGSFPEQINVVEPVVNTAFFFSDSFKMSELVSTLKLLASMIVYEV